MCVKMKITREYSIHTWNTPESEVFIHGTYQRVAFFTEVAEGKMEKN